MKNLKLHHLAIPLGTGILILFLTVLFLVPKLQELGQLNQRNQELKSSLSKYTLKLASLEEIDQEALSSQVQKSQTFLPTEKDIAQALIVTRALNEQTGMIIKKMTVESVDPVGIMPSVGVQVTAEIAADQVVPFLTRIATALPLISVDSISLSARAGADFEISYVLRNYYLAYPSRLGSLEAALMPITSQERSVYDAILTGFQYLLPTVDVEATGSGTIPSGKGNPFIP